MRFVFLCPLLCSRGHAFRSDLESSRHSGRNFCVESAIISGLPGSLPLKKINCSTRPSRAFVYNSSFETSEITSGIRCTDSRSPTESPRDFPTEKCKRVVNDNVTPVSCAVLVLPTGALWLETRQVERNLWKNDSTTSGKGGYITSESLTPIRGTSPAPKT